MFRQRAISLAGIIFAIPMLMLSECGLARADDQGSNEISGIPLVENSGHIMLEGRNIALWGIDTLACDQHCWQNDKPWPCGEEATMVLKHFVEGRPVTCRIMSAPGAGKISAQCFRHKGEKMQDIARLLVKHGWAMDDDDEPDSKYAEDEEEARKGRRGIWTSRFQTAEDWHSGTQQFIDYDMEPPSFLSRIIHGSGEGEPPPHAD
jgi:endonuclease YncB( thermonuclease family)